VKKRVKKHLKKLAPIVFWVFAGALIEQLVCDIPTHVAVALIVAAYLFLRSEGVSIY